jgi:hypothetical protein
MAMVAPLAAPPVELAVTGRRSRYELTLPVVMKAGLDLARCRRKADQTSHHSRLETRLTIIVGVRLSTMRRNPSRSPQVSCGAVHVDEKRTCRATFVPEEAGGDVRS